MEEIIEKELQEFIESFKELRNDFPNYYNNLVTSFITIANNLKTDVNFKYSTDDPFLSLLIRKEFLKKNQGSKRNYFTISSKESFIHLPSIEIDNNWGNSLIYYPLNDHSRGFLEKGDLLFCYRQGQFSDLNEALNMRGIYGIGIAASDPVLLFPQAENHNKWAVLVCFPINIYQHLQLRNIQMHPNTIDLTPYNGNRNDALQHIPEKKHFLTLLNMLYSENYEIQLKFKSFFPDIDFEEIPLPNTLFTKYYSQNYSSVDLNQKTYNLNLIQDKFIEWFHKPENFKKSYEGLVTSKVLKFWNENYFNNSLFLIDCSHLDSSLTKIEKLIGDKNNLEWRNYSEASSKGAPEAVLGKNNYLKFLIEFFNKIENIELLKNSKLSLVQKKEISKSNFKIDALIEMLNKASLYFSNKIIQRFVASLLTKPFVICNGLSGSGKTKLAQAFVYWITESNMQYRIIPVGSDWTNREPLLGYPNGLDPFFYITPDSGALQLIIEALKDENQNKPYFLILDEMNLSHVERYFADFLSIMESGDSIKLYSGNDRTDYDGNTIMKEIIWPKNLFIIGTVNIDETTYMFSPKVLDRANVIEFRITTDDMNNFLMVRNEINMNYLFLDQDINKGGEGQHMAESFMNIAKEKTVIKIPELEGEHNVLNKFFSELQLIGSEFGYRSAAEIELLITNLGNIGFLNNEDQFIANNAKVDIAIMQKLLPKLHGSRSKLSRVLPKLGKLCMKSDKEQDAIDIFNQFKESRDITFEGNEAFKYPISFEKLCRMWKNAQENGFASFAEA